MKKKFFQRPTVAQLKKHDPVDSAGTLEQMMEQVSQLQPGQVYLLSEQLLKEEPAHRFKKRGPSVPLIAPRGKEYRYIRQGEKPRLLVLDARPSQTPLQTLEHMFTMVDRFDMSGYGWLGEGRDQRYRHVALTKILSGAMLFAYESRLKDNEVKIYEGNGHATEQGLLAYTTLSSESEKKVRHEVELRGVPIHKHGQWKRIQSIHSCPAKMWSETRYDHSYDPERIMFCKHDIAAYFKLAAYCSEELKNKYPALLSPFVPPTQTLVDYYKTLRSQVIVRAKDKEDRLMNEAEMEQFIFSYVKRIGVPASFRANPLDADYKLKDRDWS